ncbi:uncharacterized protein PgNI_07509 [Pyricularia grisea]|uniref:PH domain-containing protein n=1 Tax=Pyricularia grisea TaxID=148305 RepID=A0A6P8B0Z8_PYRGI|nr:uncharacterized protein PgNI_07509 [Pyricularia grisea]TLD08501.1 hypothetical protein PgNI_07509 [Pyricularia grisea]
MDHPNASQAPFAHLDQLHSSQLQNRRLRPPDMEKMALGDENRTPLRPNAERPRRRDSKLLGLFSRQKSTVDLPMPQPQQLPQSQPAFSSSVRDLELPPRGGLRASLAEISNWPYALQSTRSEVALLDPTIPPQISASPCHHRPPPPKPSRSPSFTTNSIPVPNPPSLPPARSTRGALATWDPPPLFQGYPQAIRYIELPACTQSAEAILRMNGRSTADQAEAVPDKTRDKGKRKHRRASSGNFLKADWTTKIYILVTSGYLLQYAGEGSFDRLPEKILPLGKDSVAFASDVIPGKHWVVQVSASMDSDGTATADPRASILSRLPFRGPERRQASHFLMVFESAEEMDQWIAILRREIEHLGGKKSLSETGKPKADDERLELRAQASQRTLVLRDPERFARPTVLDGDRWGIDEHTNGQDAQSTLLTDSDTATDHQSFDEMSTTNSTTSHDGRQLENLRDGSNRLSFISSSQRTFVTSEGTSPACSPSRTSFSSQIEDGPFSNDGLVTEAKPRPNAQAILQRRMSMQATNPFADIQMAPQAQSSRSNRACHLDGTHQNITNTYCTRNFSMPHSANKRFSVISSPGSSPEPALELSPHATGLSAPPRPSSKRGPPPTLGFSRPLSMVPDHPSPISPPGVLRKKNGDNRQWGVGADSPEPRSIFQIWAQEASTKPPLPPQEVTADEAARRASVHALMPSRMPRHSPNSQSRQQTHIKNASKVTTPDQGFVRRRSFASPGVSAKSEMNPQSHSGRAASSAAAFYGSPTPQRRSSPRSSVRAIAAAAATDAAGASNTPTPPAAHITAEADSAAFDAELDVGAKFAGRH